MSELMFVIKSLVITAVLLVLMQVKIGHHSIEAYSEYYLTRSSASVYVQSVAAGGALALKNLAMSLKSAVTGTVDSYRQGSSAQAGK
jgi:hypothetical protein